MKKLNMAVHQIHKYLMGSASIHVSRAMRTIVRVTHLFSSLGRGLRHRELRQDGAENVPITME
jgi:hypothetical protein